MKSSALFFYVGDGVGGGVAPAFCVGVGDVSLSMSEMSRGDDVGRPLSVVVPSKWRRCSRFVCVLKPGRGRKISDDC